MPPAMLNTRRLKLAKRALFRMNFGGRESNPEINGDRNRVVFNAGPLRGGEDEEETLLRKAGTEVGRILEGGTDVVIAPAKWLVHMQQNWLVYIVCATILMAGILFIYCCIRRKASVLRTNACEKAYMSTTIMDEAIKLATVRHALQDK